MSENDNMLQGYLSKVTERLKEQGFHISQDGKFKSQSFELVARKTKFDMEKFGLAAVTYSFATFSSPDRNTLREFAAKSFRYALKSGGIHPPRGILYSVWCFPVAIVDLIDATVAEAIRKRAPPVHWAAQEMLVVCSLNQKALHYSEATPAWGSMYYDQMRERIKTNLAP